MRPAAAAHLRRGGLEGVDHRQQVLQHALLNVFAGLLLLLVCPRPEVVKVGLQPPVLVLQRVQLLLRLLSGGLSLLHSRYQALLILHHRVCQLLLHATPQCAAQPSAHPIVLRAGDHCAHERGTLSCTPNVS